MLNGFDYFNMAVWSYISGEGDFTPETPVAGRVGLTIAIPIQARVASRPEVKL